MKAIVFDQSLAISEPNALFETDLPMPEAKGHDLLVRITATSINPIDSKLRLRALPEKGEPKVLGFDAVGVVEAVGQDVTLFKQGDRVFYAGDMTRPGSHAEYQLVDERIVGNAPSAIGDEAAAAMPLTSLTAYEILFDRLQVGVKPRFSDAPSCLLVTGAAGGVGSVLIQLAKAICPEVVIIATASRDYSQDWCKKMGADYVINHHNCIANEVAKLDAPPVTHIASLTHTANYFNDFAELINPQGKICLIDDPSEALNIQALKIKSVSLHWELMFTRSKFQTDDMIQQHYILNEVAELLDNKKIQSTHTHTIGPMSADNMKIAHAQIEKSSTIGKWVLLGF